MIYKVFACCSIEQMHIEERERVKHLLDRALTILYLVVYIPYHRASLEGVYFFKGNKHMSYITEKPFLR